MFVFEVPTGVVADVYSRRRSILIGMVLVGAGFVLEGAVPVFTFMLLAQLLWGLGYTFESGAVEAWISDEIGEARVGKAFLRAAQVRQLMGLLGIPFVLALAFYWAYVLLRTVNHPLFSAWLNQSLESETRATGFSMNGQMDALGQIAGGPLLGWVARAYGLPLAFVIAGIVLLPAGVLYLRTLRNAGSAGQYESGADGD